MSQPPKVVIVGRDGILNTFREDHVKEPQEWQPIPGALEAIARLHHAGWHVVVATNQPGIGRGLIDISSINAVHAHMMKRLAQHGGRIDAVFFCPHAPDEQCECRKPLPGLMRQVAQRYGVDLAQVPMAGDTVRDLEAAHAAGCEPHLVKTGRATGFSPEQLAALAQDVPRLQVHRDLAAFAEFLVKRAGAAHAGAEGRHR